MLILSSASFAPSPTAENLASPHYQAAESNDVAHRQKPSHHSLTETLPNNHCQAESNTPSPIAENLPITHYRDGSNNEPEGKGNT